MKNLKKPVALLTITAVAAAAWIVQAAQYVSYSTYVDGSTNTVVVAGTNALVSYVGQVSTNFYQLPNSNTSTNAFPQVSIIPNNNVTTPARLVSVLLSAIGTNASVVTFQFASSVDSLIWQTNFQRVALTMNGSGTALGTPVMTNVTIDTLGLPFVNLYSVETPNGQVTNMIIRASSKPGF